MPTKRSAPRGPQPTLDDLRRQRDALHAADLAAVRRADALAMIAEREAADAQHAADDAQDRADAAVVASTQARATYVDRYGVEPPLVADLSPWVTHL